MSISTYNFAINGDLNLWDSGPVPREMDAQVTNTTLTRLEESFPEERSERRAWTEIAGRNGDRFTYAGRNALRATITSSGSASDFRLGPEGVSLTAFTGATAFQTPMEGGFRYRVAFAARTSVDGNTMLVRVVLRNNADGVELYLQSDGTWATADTTRPTFGLGPRWGVYGVSFDAPFGNANDVIENMVWQLANGSSGAQIIDIGEIRIECLTISRGSR